MTGHWVLKIIILRNVKALNKNNLISQIHEKNLNYNKHHKFIKENIKESKK